ncbi:pyridoxal phosphate-dependent decarboxylase family protein [Actinopolymorpha pittospori]
MSQFPLEPGRAEMAEMGTLVLDHVLDFLAGLRDRPTNGIADRDTATLVREFLAPPPEKPGDLRELLDRVDRAVDHAHEIAGPGMMAYVPGGGLYTAALAEFYNRATNRFGSLAFQSPALSALEESVLRWAAQDVCGLPAGSTGLLTSGGSMATFSAVVAARHAHLGEDLRSGTLYITESTHHSVAKAARLAGIPASGVRIVPGDDDLRMDVDAAAAMIRSDRAAGLHPFLLVGSAGTTNTGCVDPLPAMADLAEQENLWFHVDAAYGGFFRLTSRGRHRLAGTERADSVTLDPHKSLFIPYGTGALVVRDPATLYAAHAGDAGYLQDIGTTDGLPTYARMGPELSREVRGLRAWLPLHLHGVTAFRDALEEKLDLAEHAHDKLSTVPALEVPWRPELTTVAFRVRPRATGTAAAEEADRATRHLLDRVNASQRVLLASTVIAGRQTIRLCILVHRTHGDRVGEALDLITAAAEDL